MRPGVATRTSVESLLSSVKCTTYFANQTYSSAASLDSPLDMHLSSPLAVLIPAVALVTTVAAGPYAELHARTTTETCGYVSSELVVTSSLTHRPTSVGFICA